MKSINHLFPEMTKPIITGLLSNEREGMGSRSDSGDIEGHCTLHEGTIDPEGQLITGKPIGLDKGHGDGPKGDGESTCRMRTGGPEKKILAPSYVRRIGNDLIPEPKIVLAQAGDRSVVYFHAPDRLVINNSRPSAAILLEGSSKDPEQMKSRLLPLLVRAAFGAYPGSTELNGEELFRMESSVLDSVWSKSK